jgi:hypothetical protein
MVGSASIRTMRSAMSLKELGVGDQVSSTRYVENDPLFASHFFADQGGSSRQIPAVRPQIR